ncbi:hypothetical protein HHI36_013184 [Cryptolaemus montrouzieri]|uniref:Uncharacterized protein n=1 Tax=Cryptolaemus montrouzieri TaxID=559131 RepID=A0ABD2NGS0_9CUCU
MEAKLFERIKDYFDAKLDSQTQEIRVENEKLFARRLIIATKKAHAEFKVSGAVLDQLAFSQLRSQCKISSKQCYDAYLVRVENSISKNPKEFWNYVNSSRRDHGIAGGVFLTQMKMW